MELTLYRKWRKEKYTIGDLYINGEFFSNTLEDRDRNLYQSMSKDFIMEEKVYGETAIPYGRYRITLKVQSPKYSKKKQYAKIKGYLPRLIDVPGFQGVLCHIGNYPEDSCGCILPGWNTKKGAVMNSTKAFWMIYDKMKEADDRGEEIWLTIQR